MPWRLATATQNALADQVTAQVDAGTGAGTLKVYTGTAPATANDAATGTLLATFTLADPSFGAAANGAIAPAGTPIATTASAGGTAGWGRIESSTPATVIDGDVTATGGGGEIEIDNTAITSGQTINLTGGTITMPAG